MGLIRYLEEDADEAVERIEYTIYDKDGDWAEVATDIVDALETDIDVQIQYSEIDAASRDVWLASIFRKPI